MTTDIQLVVKIRDTDLNKAIVSAERTLSDRLRAGVDRVLQRVADTQILAYTVSGNPDRLRYERTLNLQRASRIEPAKGELPNISGRWCTDEGTAPYADEVLGPRSMQAPIHVDRWKSVEEVEEIVSREADAIIAEEINEIRV